MTELKPNTQVHFKNGWMIQIHAIEEGIVYFQKFPPGVEQQMLLQNLGRMTVCEFEKLVSLHAGSL